MARRKSEGISSRKAISLLTDLPSVSNSLSSRRRQLMRHRPLARVVWVIFLATSLNVAAAFLPDLPTSPHSSDTALALAQSELDDSPLGESTSTSSSEEQNLCAVQQQSKQVPILVRSCDLVSLVSRRENLLRSAPTPVFLLIRIWFPRKLSPPSAQDEPFLS
jgi:hypothetical protein